MGLLALFAVRALFAATLLSGITLAQAPVLVPLTSAESNAVNVALGRMLCVGLFCQPEDNGGCALAACSYLLGGPVCKTPYPTAMAYTEPDSEQNGDRSWTREGANAVVLDSGEFLENPARFGSPDVAVASAILAAVLTHEAYHASDEYVWDAEGPKTEQDRQRLLDGEIRASNAELSFLTAVLNCASCFLGAGGAWTAEQAEKIDKRRGDVEGVLRSLHNQR